MKSLVTGGAGFIGSNLVDRLIEIGHEVVVIDNEYSDVHDQFYWNDKAQNYKYDIRDYENTRPLYDGVDFVFHIAAEARIQPAIQNPIQAVSINSVGTCTVLQCSREAGVKRVIYSSTSSGYGMNDSPNVESQLDDCLNPYSVSKVNGEKLCKMYTSLYGLPTICFRYFNVYGERQPLRGQYAPVIGIFLRQRAAGEPLTIVGDGNQRRDFTHVSDVVMANVLAATSSIDSKFFGEVFNVGTGTNHSVNQIAKMISDNKINLPPRSGESRVTLANNQKIQKVFEWKPILKVEDWIKNNLEQTTMRTFAVYHQCYKDKKATEFAIEQFRKYNPEVPYYLISDSGLDFSDLAEKYNCIWKYDENNVGMDFLPPDDALILYNRLVDCFEVVKTDYVLLMEDDVLCRGKIEKIDGDFNLAMSYVPGNPLVLYNTIVEKYNSNPNVNWFGATGGSILNKNIFTDSKYKNLIYKFIKEDHISPAGSMDQFITTLYLICGLDCSVNELLGETHRTPNWQNTDIPLIHCYKEMYSQKLV